MTTGKTIALTRWNFVGKTMSLLFNMFSRLVITFIPRSRHLFIWWLQSPYAVILDYYCFLTCIQISQEAAQVVWYSHLFQNFPQFIVIHTVKGFGIVNKAETFFWNSLAFSMIQRMLAIWSLVPLPFLKPAWTFGSSQFMYCWSLAWRILSMTLLVCEMSAIAR